jgi:hypothetical protein
MAGPFDYQNTGKVNQYPFTKRQMFNMSNLPCYGINSVDGTNYLNAINVSGNITDIAYNGSLYVVATGSGISTSPDLITWTTRTVPGFPGGQSGLTYGNSLFMFIGYDGSTNYNSSWTSPDGITWTQKTQVTAATTTNGTLSFAQGYFYCSVNTDNVYRSTNGVSWASVAGLASYTNRGYVDEINGVLFWKSFSLGAYIYYDQNNYYLYSTNSGTTWTALGGSASGCIGIWFYLGNYYYTIINGSSLSLYTNTVPSATPVVMRTINSANTVTTFKGELTTTSYTSATKVAVAQVLNKIIWIPVYTSAGGSYSLSENQANISDTLTDSIVNDNNKVFATLIGNSFVSGVNFASAITTPSIVRLLTKDGIFILRYNSSSSVSSVSRFNQLNEYVSL